MTATRLVPSPIGRILLSAEGSALTRLHLQEAPYTVDVPEDDAPTPAEEAALDQAEAQLAEYFRGEREDFDLELDLAGTAFQQEVWAQLLAIPYGTVISYGELARRVGRPGAARAVGSANGANPVAVIVPCHRVIAAD